uniref:Fructose-bisphosphate aldolase n=1 Tax=Setaria digitata TaxID=48799 RepID=A0A915PR26_9BILA
MSSILYRILIDGIVVVLAISTLKYYQDWKSETLDDVEETIAGSVTWSRDQQNELHAIAQKLTESGKGILAADESIDTIGKRFAMIGVENNEENRKNYRHLLFTTPNISTYISGIILHEETFNQKDDTNKRFVDIIKEAGILPGIKLDKGLDNLKERAIFFKKGGCQFSKWRCVYMISKFMPSKKILKKNAKTLAEYAILSQQAGLVPIIEPEVLWDGEHSLEKTEKVTEQVLAEVYKSLHDYGVYLEGTLLKPNMVLAGSKFKERVERNEIANETLRALIRTVPAAVPGIVFLSGGQLETDATRNLNEINKILLNTPWKLSFSYGRALQTSTLKAWKIYGRKEAQAAFLHRAKLNALAAEGHYMDHHE